MNEREKGMEPVPCSACLTAWPRRETMFTELSGWRPLCFTCWETARRRKKELWGALMLRVAE